MQTQIGHTGKRKGLWPAALSYFLLRVSYILNLYSIVND
jgi:hypothetical protein